MTDLIFHVLSWPTLAVALLVWGFAPGAALRLIVLAFPRDDPRRRELLGELYAVPRVERPFWVAEKMELAFIEGLGGRLLKAIRHWSPRRRFSVPSDTLIAFRQSPVVLLCRWLLAVEGLLVALSLTFRSSTARLTFHATAHEIEVIWALWGIILLAALWKASAWSVDRWAIRHTGLVLARGILKRRTAEIPRDIMLSISLEYSFFGRLMGYGTFLVERRDGHTCVIPLVPYPQDLMAEIDALWGTSGA